MNYTNEFVKACFSKKAPEHTIKVTWLNGSEATYSYTMANLIETDTQCLEIMDNETGEILYAKGA